MSNRKKLPPLLKIKTSPPSHHTLSKDSIAFSEEEIAEKKDEPPTPESPPANMGEYVPSRPLSVAIPRPLGAQGPYCPRRPNLSDILANTAPPPWTLSAFMAYLSQNHCLETLEFTMDASRYRKHYNKMASRSAGGQLTPGTDECNYVRMLWQRLVEAYITPNGPREVNLPSYVRDNILVLSREQVPPPPSALDLAVEKIYELMEESVLVPFLNSLYPQSAQATSFASNDSSEELSSSASATHMPSRSFDERNSYRRRRSPRSRRSETPLSASTPTSAQHYNRASAPASSFSQFARSLSHSTRQHPFSPLGHQHSHSTASTSNPAGVLSPVSGHPSNQEFGGYSPSDSIMAELTEGSASSPSALGEPMTPPTTPPMGEFGGIAYGGSPTGGIAMPVGGSHGAGRGSSGTWKKMRSSFGFKKRGGASVSFREDDEMDYR
jgi:Regulator of G protein signaling domain